MKNSTLLPKEQRILKRLGENLKLARLRRKLTAEMVAKRANISRSTLWSLETGKSNVTIESLLQILSVLGMTEELGKLGEKDQLGRKLQDAKLKSAKKK